MDGFRTVTRRDVLKLGGAALAAAGGAGLVPTAAEAQTPKRGGVFRIRGEDPLGFDPQLTTAFRTMTNLSFTHSRLVKVKAGSGSAARAPSRWRAISPSRGRAPTTPPGSSSSGRACAGIPKPPVNGRELTAEDVKYTYDRFLTVKGNPNRGILEQVDRIEAPDRYTVKFTLKEPFVWFLESLASTSTWVIPKEAVEQFGDLKKPEACIGTGPWMLERYEPNVRLTFVRNPNYFVAGLPYADGVEVTIDDDPSSRLASWIAGKYDFAPEYDMVVRRLDLPLAKQRKPNLQTGDFTTMFGGITWMKLDQEPFKDVRVRRALAVASNWKEVLETNAWSQGHGCANPAVPSALREWSIPIDQLTPLGRSLYEQNIAEAKKLLAEAGLPQRLQDHPGDHEQRLRPRLSWTPCRSG